MKKYSKINYFYYREIFINKEFKFFESHITYI